MNKVTSRPLDYNELKELSSIGGNDAVDVGTEPYALTAVACSIIATLTVVSLVASQIASCKEVCS